MTTMMTVYGKKPLNQKKKKKEDDDKPKPIPFPQLQKFGAQLEHLLTPTDPSPRVDMSAWLARQRFEKGIESTEMKFLLPVVPEDNRPKPLPHTCWLDSPSPIVAINKTLHIYGCRVCRRTHHCQSKWDLCVKLDGPSGSKICAHSAYEIVSGDSALGKYEEECRVSSLLRQKTPGTRVQSKEFNRYRKEGSQLDKQAKRTEKLRGLEASLLGEASAHEDEDGDDDDEDYDSMSDQRSAKRARTEDASHEIFVDEADGYYDDDDDGDREGDDPYENIYDDGDVSGGDDRSEEMNENDEDMDASDAEEKTNDAMDIDTEAKEAPQDYNSESILDKVAKPTDGEDGDNNNNGPDGEDADGRILENVYAKLGMDDVMRNGLSSMDILNSNMRLLQTLSDINPPWEEPLSQRWGTTTNYRIRRQMAAINDQSTHVLLALAKFDEENGELMRYGMSAAAAGSESITASQSSSTFDFTGGDSSTESESSSVSGSTEDIPSKTTGSGTKPRCRADYEKMVSRILDNVTEDVKNIVTGLCSDPAQLLARMEIYTRLCHRLVRLILKVRPIAVSTLNQVRIAVAMLLDLLMDPYTLPDCHGNVTGQPLPTSTVTTSLTGASEWDAPAIPVWSADPWLKSEDVQKRLRQFVIDNKAASTIGSAKGVYRFPRTLIKSWANQIKALLHKTPVSPFALRDALFDPL